MNEIQEVSMNDLLSEFDVKRINKGDILNGEVINVSEKEVSVNINYAFDGVISREELTATGENPLDVISSGDKIQVYVISPNDGEGYVVLSRKRALSIVEKEELVEAFKNEKIITVKVKEEVKGGLVAYYGETRIFIPASLASRERIVLKELEGKDLEVKLTEVDFKNRRIVASRRILEDAQYQIDKKKIWETIKPGEKRTGEVKKIIRVGAIVDIGGVTGLIHISDLAWGKVNRVEDIVNVGDSVEVFIGNVDEDKERISLILKDVNSDPWTVNADACKIGATLEGKVTNLLAFGAFVEVFPGVEGLVHLSEICDDHISKPDDVLKAGQIVKVKVLKVNKEDKKLSLSIKECEEKSKEYLQYNDEEDGVSLGELFKGMFN
ncbi:SSU ribosomal protein S1P [Clostridium gasigenes]|uniref:SSU ribosomal protein S1P n=2 Tax=Clostridium gasigenes TaxID=94869 RepID=A0A1H0RZM5_9CLOT|nr:30S ribosomal protein S1 [Clostridium gasigenes]SDP34825.1 SSU ribosomal protein S1P [Clostridium gasigenes]